MCRSARLYNCVRCHRQVIICSHCDRGNSYCSDICSVQSRQEKQQQAKARYQSSAKGRQSHALRQQHYRQRQKQKVTYQGSVELSPYDLLPDEPKKVATVITSPLLAEKSTCYCHFCGCRCNDQLRWVFLHQHSRQTLQVHSF